MPKRISVTKLLFYFLFVGTFISCNKTFESSADIQMSSEFNDTAVLGSVHRYLDLRQDHYVDSGKIVVGFIKQNALYDDITVEQLNSSEKLIILPLKNAFETRNKVNAKSFKTIVFIQAADHKTIRSADIVEFIPADQTVTKIPKNTISNVYNNLTISTNGKLSLLTLHNRNICDLIYQDGKLKNLNIAFPKQNGNRIYPYKSNLSAINCTDWYWEYYIGGVLVGEEYLYTTCSGCDEEQPYKMPTGKVNCGGGGGPGSGNGSSYETLISVDYVVNDLLNPCANAAFNAITSDKLKNCLVRLYQQTFVGVNHIHNLKFTTVSSILDPATGGQLPIASHPDPTNSNTWEIVTNSGFDGQFTQELWGSMLIHEVVHSFIQKNSLDFSPTSSFTNSHQIMLTSWINDMQQDLIDAFGISSSDAMALVLEGFTDILADTNGQFKADMKQWVQSHYGVDLNIMSQTANGYYDKTKGTPCQ